MTERDRVAGHEDGEPRGRPVVRVLDEQGFSDSDDGQLTCHETPRGARECPPPLSATCCARTGYQSNASPATANLARSFRRPVRSRSLRFQTIHADPPMKTPAALAGRSGAT